MQFVDTHAHIHFKNYAVDSLIALQQAELVEVGKIICVGTTLADSKLAVSFAEKHPNVWAAVGAHPHDALNFNVNAARQLRELTELAHHPKVVAIGEVGLDFFKNYTTAADQKTLFRAMLQMGVAAGKPFIFHIREAFDDAWAMIDAYAPGCEAVVHSFSNNTIRLQQALRRNFYIGLNGIMTFTNDEEQLAAAKAVPLAKLLLETDAPFLTPKPFRGKVCEPKHVKVTAEFLAQLRGEDLIDLARISTQNAHDLFSIH